jgi:hypothetical protein
MFSLIFKLFPALWWVLKKTVLKDKKSAQAAVKVVKKGGGLFPFVIGAATAAGAFIAAPYVKAAIEVYKDDLANKNESESNSDDHGAGSHASFQNHENN